VFPIMLNFLQMKIGWKDAVRVSAGVVGVLLIVANCIMKTRTAVMIQKSGGGTNEKLNGGGQTTIDRMKVILKDGAYVWSVAGYV
jgi:hypothetical protein